MFWIPICVVAVIICVTGHIVNLLMEEASIRRYSNRRSAMKAFSTRITDVSLQNQLTEEMRKNIYGHKVISDFMEGDERYAKIQATPCDALTVLMAKRGKLPCAALYLDHRMYRTFPRQEYDELRERFLLKIEAELRSHGVNTFIVGNWSPQPEKERYESLRRHVERCGYGESNYSVKLWWIQYAPEGAENCPY